MRQRQRFALLTLTILLSAAPAAGQSNAGDGLLSWSEQIAVREGWLEKRHDMLLPMMRRHGLNMWIVVNESPLRLIRLHLAPEGFPCVGRSLSDDECHSDVLECCLSPRAWIVF